THRRQAADDERASIAAAHTHPLSAAHAQPFELGPEGFDFAPERLVIQRAGGINDRRLVGPLARGLGKGFVNVHFNLHPTFTLTLTLNLNLSRDTQLFPHASGPASCSGSDQFPETIGAIGRAALLRRR